MNIQDLIIKENKPLAGQGDVEAQYTLGSFYELGGISIQNPHEAIKWYTLAAEQGHSQAQYDLGLIYSSARINSVPLNHKEAFKWYMLAAENGHAEAQAMIGLYYTSEELVPINYTESAKWLRLAAEQGDSEAQCHLGLAYYNGLGVPLNYKFAYMWLSLGIAQMLDDEDIWPYRASLKKCELKMTNSQIAQAQDMATEWLKNFEAVKKITTGLLFKK